MSDVRIGKGAGSLRRGEIKECKPKARDGGVMFAVQEQRLMLMESCDQARLSLSNGEAGSAIPCPAVATRAT